jgi:hypothetical protein
LIKRRALMAIRRRWSNSEPLAKKMQQHVKTYNKSLKEFREEERRRELKRLKKRKGCIFEEVNKLFDECFKNIVHDIEETARGGETSLEWKTSLSKFLNEWRWARVDLKEDAIQVLMKKISEKLKQEEFKVEIPEGRYMPTMIIKW